MKTALVLLFASVVETGSLAQGTFLTGYYITQEDDTIRGYIDRRPEMTNYYFFIFKAALPNESVKFFPQDAKGFVILDTEFYEKHNAPDEFGRNVDGFYKLVLKSRLSLLKYESKFFAKTSDNAIFLVSTRRVPTDPPKDDPRVRDANAQIYGKFYKTDYSGLGLLKAHMQDCPEVARSLEGAYLAGKPDFLSIFDSYNRCTGSPVFKTGKLKKSRVNVGIKDLKREPGKE